MGNRDDDQRVRRTREAIVGSFNGLFLTRGYGSFGVADIIEGAGVGRSTFYEHFFNKDAVLRQAAGGILRTLAEAATGRGDVGALAHLARHFAQNRDQARLALCGESHAPLCRELAAMIEALVRAMCEERRLTPSVPERIIARQAAEAQFALVGAWLDAAQPCSPEALVAALAAGAWGGVRALLS